GVSSKSLSQGAGSGDCIKNAPPERTGRGAGAGTLAVTYSRMGEPDRTASGSSQPANDAPGMARPATPTTDGCLPNPLTDRTAGGSSQPTNDAPGMARPAIPTTDGCLLVGSQ